MGNTLKFDYYYGIEAEQFSFYRVPRLLITDERFKFLSSDAKLLYGLMLDRMSLSMKNGWFDDENRAYIYYTIDNIMNDLGCAREKAVKVSAELDSKKGIGLIEKKRQGLGKPDIIYVKNFTVVEKNISMEDSPENFESLEVRNSNFKKSDIQTSRSAESEFAEVRKTNGNNNNKNYTEKSNTNPIHIRQKENKIKADEIDNSTDTYIELIRDNLDYYNKMSDPFYTEKDKFEELVNLVIDTVCFPPKKIMVGGNPCPYEVVKSRFLKLTSSHLDYVIESMGKTTSEKLSVRNYMITALYNAPTSMMNYIHQKVQYDMYGGGWEEKGIL